MMHAFLAGALLLSQSVAATSVGPLYPSYVSLSIELGSFPSFAGTRKQPNVYSKNLLEYLAKAQGSPCVIRVGGNSADRAIYDSTLTTATASRCSADPEAIQCIGPSFFDSYGAFPAGTKYSHNFNLAANNASGYDTLLQTAPLACKALRGQLDSWEMGNEPDLFRGKWRPSDWTAAQYEVEWKNATDHLRTYIQKACPDLARSFVLTAPSVSSPGSGLNAADIFKAGEDSEGDVKIISVHNYMGGATQPGVTLQGTLMNHTNVVNAVQGHVRYANSLANVPADYILGEHNSLYGGGAAGTSNVFGAALWVLEISLNAASTGIIKREHFHQSVGAPYSAWVPVQSGSNAPQTLPPYYGKLAAATFLADSAKIQVKTISLGGNPDFDSAYGAYQGGQLERIALLNLREYDSDSTTARGSQTYTVKVKPFQIWTVERLTAAGAHDVTGVTYNGYAYEYSSLGKAVRVKGRTSSELAIADGFGNLRVKVADSEAVIIKKALL
ncbi:glycoside hydrolase family 79 protein [Xylogone sp. PMI_703]|nr:glycoside hydrolase family 79 protein [Xylogone sp. PMI_703]